MESLYFSECFKAYGLPPARTGAPKYLYDTEVMCTTYFSRLNPLDNGEVFVLFLASFRFVFSISPI